MTHAAHASHHHDSNAATPAAWTFVDGTWHEGNPAIAGPLTHAFWCASSVFDGARVFEGVAPDLLPHCQRVNQSAHALHLEPTMEPEEIANLSLDAARRFAMDEALYVRPMYFAEAGGFMGVPPDASSTRFCLTVFHVPMPDWEAGMRVGLTSFRRPTLETMPTNAKSGCLYPNNGRAILEVQKRGFQNALVLDMLGNVAELATANVFLVRDGVVQTPAPNGTFLNGITRQRIIGLLRDAGIAVEETILSVADFHQADEVFSCGNYGKVTPITHFEGRDLAVGAVTKKAKNLYWAFAHDGSNAP
ncbi:MAG: branched-chain amino acid aminotransferase [Cohaesibacteraceae bacterium]